MIEEPSERMPRYSDFIANFRDVSKQQLEANFQLRGSGEAMRIQLGTTDRARMRSPEPRR